MQNNIENHLKYELSPLDFVFGKTIDECSFGEVVIGTHKTSKKQYAIKIITIRQKENQPENLRLIKDELARWNKITSINPRPNSIPNYYGYYIETTISMHQNYALIFDYFPQSLKTLISEETTISLSQLKHIYDNLIDGLTFLQSLNICHRNLSPKNLMLDQHKNLKIIDFEHTIDLPDSDKNKYDLTIVGKEPYMAPEILEASIKEKNNVILLIINI